MTKFKNLFALNDLLGIRGVVSMWFMAFTTSFVVLLVDDTQGVSRNFCGISQLLCCTNLVALGHAVANNISWSKASFYTLHFDTFATWLAFAYFGGDAVLGQHPIGVWNWVQIIFTVLNSVAGIAGLYVVGGDPVGFNQYLKQYNKVDGETTV